MADTDETITVDFGDPYQVAALIQRLADSIAQANVEIAALTRVIEYQAIADGAPGFDRFRGQERLRAIANHALGEFPSSNVLAALANAAAERAPTRTLKLVHSDLDPAAPLSTEGSPRDGR